MGRKQRQKEKQKKLDNMFRMILKSFVSSKLDIGRCRCVCKKWRSFLSTPEFKREHLQNHQVTIDDYKLVGIDKLNRLCTFSFNETLPLSFSNCPGAITFKASLDGLVCFSFVSSEVLMLTNPLTGTIKTLPRIPSEFFAAVDPVGFYIDPFDNNDYKLVCVPFFGTEGAYVYSHRSNKWKHIEFPIPRPLELDLWSPATLYRQSLYFEVARGSLSRIIRFDVRTETFKEIPAPDLTYKGCFPFAGLVVLKGCLYLNLSYEISDENDGVDVWRMKDDDEWESVKAFTVGKKQQERILIETTENWLAVWNYYENTFKKMSTEEFTTHDRCFYSKFVGQDRLIYVQTLVDP